MSVNHYRVFCETEQSYAYIWSTLAPSVCPNNNTHTITTNSISIIDQVNNSQTEITNLQSDNVETLQVLEKNVIFNLPSYLGVSLYRNKVITMGSGSITSSLLTDSEINMNCSGANDSAILRSIERGVYIPGLTCEAGIAIRLPSNQLTGNQTLTWGYFSNENGFYFKLTSTSFEVCIVNNSNEICISRENFNEDKVDGTGKSGHVLDFSKGNIFVIMFSWYGFGLVSFQLIGNTKTSRQKTITLHTYQTVGQTSTRIPNLPIQVQLKNNGTVANTSVYVAGRQFSVLGNYNPLIRTISMHKYLATISHEVFTPIFSIKRNNDYAGCTVKISDVHIKASVDCEIKIVTGCTLNTPSWINLPNYSESACHIDLSSTSYTGGMYVFSLICFAGESIEHELKNLHLNEDLPLTMSCKSLTGQNGNVTIRLDWDEYW